MWGASLFGFGLELVLGCWLGLGCNAPDAQFYGDSDGCFGLLELRCACRAESGLLGGVFGC